jgi:uncharacterized membrane protein
VAGGIGAPIRPAIIFCFLLLCPGMAFIPLLRLRDRLTELTLAVALSLALDTAVAETMVLTKQWSPQVGLVVLISISLVGAALQIIMFRAREDTRRALP